MLVVSNVSVELNGQTLLDAINFELHSGELLHIQGRNGSGKSTLLKAIAGLIELSGGQVLYNGENTCHERHSFQRSLAYLGHKLGLKSRLSAQENIGNISNDIMVIGEFSHKLLEDLSAGQKHRVALSRVINSAARLWLLDEPYTALDQLSIDNFNKALKQHLANAGIAVISSHQSFSLQDVPVKHLQLAR